MNRLKLLLSVVTTLFIFQSCVEYRDDPACKEFSYLSLSKLREGVKILEPKEIEKAGKIYIYKNILLVSESNRGIHLIDNSNKEAPQEKAFLEIYGNLDMAVKDGYLYADSYMDLLVLDIRNLDKIKEVNRTVDIFPYDPYQNLDRDYFESGCTLNSDKGVIIKGDAL